MLLHRLLIDFQEILRTMDAIKVSCFKTVLYCLAISSLLLVSACSHMAPTLLADADTAVLEKHYLDGKRYEANKNSDRAWSSYLKAADKGYAPAQAVLGFMKYRGYGSERLEMVKLGGLVLHPNAKYYFELAANQNNAAGQYGLGELYFYGKGGAEQNVDQALEWYEKAAQQNYIDAQATLAELYAHGRIRKKLHSPGVARNLERAWLWLEKAVLQGHANSQYGACLSSRKEYSTCQKVV